MCGRYVRRGDKQKLADYFGATPNPAELRSPIGLQRSPDDASAHYPPEQTLSRARAHPRPLGLVPFFTTDLKSIKGLSTINARSETITGTSTWRELFIKRRCLVPASAFYEWPKEGKPPKQPYVFNLSTKGTLIVPAASLSDSRCSRKRKTTVRFRASRGSEQYQVMNCTIANL